MRTRTAIKESNIRFAQAAQMCPALEEMLALLLKSDTPLDDFECYLQSNRQVAEMVLAGGLGCYVNAVNLLKIEQAEAARASVN